MQNRHGRKVPSQGSKSETGANAQQRQLQQQLDRFNAPWHGLVQRPENNNWWVNAEDIQDEDLFRYHTYDLPPTFTVSDSALDQHADHPQPSAPTLNNVQESQVTKDYAGLMQKRSKSKIGRFEDDEMMNQDLHLRTNYGLHRYRIIPDGNCLYRSMAQALCNNQEQHMQLRKEVVRFLRKNLNRFKTYIEGDPAAYLRETSQENEWGGYLEILAFTELFDMNIIIVLGGCTDNKKVQVTCHHFSGDVTPKETVWLSWLSNGHYDLIVDYKPTNAEYHEWRNQKQNSNRIDEELAKQLEEEENNKNYPSTSSHHYDEDRELAIALQQQFDNDDLR